jgi:GNAT superfamily N-acetyltransferase
MNPIPVDLPAPLTSRPLVPSDVPAVTEVVADCELHDIGEVWVEEADVRSDWQRPSFDLATESVGVFDGDRMVAVAEVFTGRRAEGAVRPEYRGRGIGGALVRWTWEVARAAGSQLVGQTVPEGLADATTLFVANGYRVAYTSWVLELPDGVAVSAADLPAGVSVREFLPGRDEPAAYQVIEDAFNEWPGRTPQGFEDWAPGVLGRDGFEPWNLLVAVERGADGAEAVVGACHVVLSGREGWVNQVAVRRDRRDRGIARALLVRAIDEARSRGATKTGLNTDSRTGALGLYEKIGMRVSQTFLHWVKDLGQTE